MEYVNYLADAVDVDSSDRKLSYQLYSDNNIMNIFKSFNYTLVSSHPFSDYLTLSDSEICMAMPYLLVNSKPFYGNRRYCTPYLLIHSEH